MGRGKGKKGKRGGKPGRSPATARRPEAVAVKTPVAPSQPESSLAAPTSPPPQMAPAAAAATPQAAPREPAGAGSAWASVWRLRLRAIGMRLGIYGLFLLGAYCILVGLFSPWGFNIWDTGDRSAWGVFWLALGGGLLYAGWYLSAPDAPTDAQGKSKDQRPRR